VNITERDVAPLMLLGALFVGALVTANVIAAKIVMIGPLFVPAGVLAYSITFAVTDTLCEVWNRRITQIVVNAGFAVLVLVWALIALALQWPAAPFWLHQESFLQTLGSTNRIIVASLIAYGVSQTLDVWVFSRIKTLTGGRWLWLRNNVSTFLSQLVDTVIFISIAFYGELPILQLMWAQLLVKYGIALADTPVVYGLVYLVRRRLGQPAARRR
jgi:hypothetical protein